MELSLLEDAPFAFSALFDRIDHPPRGRDGGADGAGGTIGLQSGAPLNGKGTQTIPSGERVVIEMPGGGGLGDAKTRDRTLVVADARAGLISKQAAHDQYGIALTPEGDIDTPATDQLRNT